jgi:hypothetical protein
MTKRAEASGIHLGEADAALIKGMLTRGDRQHDIAAWFGVNGGRIAEVATGARFSWVTEAKLEDLPPPGPYPKASQAVAAIEALEVAKGALTAAEKMIKALGK